VTTTGGRRVATSDGRWFDAHVAVPDAGRGPGILLCHEALGTTDYLRAVADRLAALGYLVVAPDVFWRIERNVSLGHDDAGLARAGELLGRFDREAAVRDMVDALAMLADQPEVRGPAGVMGHCFGGFIAYLTACAAERPASCRTTASASTARSTERSRSPARRSSTSAPATCSFPSIP
jgi:carboxymethylenebutenolidase